VTGETHHVDAGYHVVGMKAVDAPDIDLDGRTEAEAMNDRLPHEKGFHVSWDQIHRDARAGLAARQAGARARMAPGKRWSRSPAAAWRRR
jgi:hypothetical protein